MSFTDRRALETLPARLEALQEKIARLNGDLADPDLYLRDPKRFNQTTTALAAAQAEMDAAEEQWLSLELLRERLERKRPEC
jgi:ATP-binding cassette subfamily F protein uup